MTPVEYSKWRLTTERYPDHDASTLLESILYPALKLNGEAGEVAEKVGKAWRDIAGRIDETALAFELGDVLWCVDAIAHRLGYEIEHLLQLNYVKLESRRARGTLAGSGDDR